MIKNFFTNKFKVKGENNEVIAIKSDKKTNVLFGSKNSSFLKIEGNNNKVIFNYTNTKKISNKLPKGLTIIIVGDNNLVEIEFPISFTNTALSLKKDNNVFRIGKTNWNVRNCKFFPQENSSIIIGRDCQFDAGNITIIANNNHDKHSKIEIGNDCYFARDVLIRNSNGHTILDANTMQPVENQEPLDLILEDDVWVSSRCTLLRKTYVSKGSIIGACSLVNKRFDEQNVVIAGTPAKVIKRDITWDKRHYGEYMRALETESQEV